MCGTGLAGGCEERVSWIHIYKRESIKCGVHAGRQKKRDDIFQEVVLFFILYMRLL